MSRMSGQLFGSIEAAASRDLSNLMIDCMDRMMPDFETSTIMRTVGNVVIRFWGCGGRIVMGTAPKYRQP